MVSYFYKIKLFYYHNNINNILKLYFKTVLYIQNTIGIIVSKRNDKFILEYVSDLSLTLTTYKLENNLKKAAT